MAVLPYIIQIAFFGAAGASFVRAHLQNQAARDTAAGVEPARRWRMFRHPHRHDAAPLSAAVLKHAALLHSAWGFAYLGGAMATPFVFQLLGLGR